MIDVMNYHRQVPEPDAIHYMMSEEAQQSLQVLTGALLGVATLCGTPQDELGPDFGCEDAEPIFRLCGEYSRGLLSELVVRKPPRPSPSRPHRCVEPLKPVD